MSRYIDSEKVIEEICSWLDSVGSIIIGKGLSSYGELIGCMQDVPVADVEKVKHGEWIYHECVSSYGGTISGHSCSVCKAFVNEETFDNDTFYKKYCGNCGARMDGDTDDR